MTATIVEGYTKEQLHAELINVIITAASRTPADRSWPAARNGSVDALAPGEADRIVRHMAESDLAPEWRFRYNPRLREGLQKVFAVYRRMEWSVN
jgi:hypothetical protein